jgi:hypothetical protein
MRRRDDTPESRAAFAKYMREYAKNAPSYYKKKAIRVKRWRSENRDKARAHSRVGHAVESGRLVRPDTCEYCCNAIRVFAHHYNYDHALEVTWLCDTCHKSVHEQLSEAVYA